MPAPQVAEAAAFQHLRERSAAAAAAAGRGAATAYGSASATTTPAGRPVAVLQIDLTKVTIPVLAINGEFDSPHAKTQRMSRELKNFSNVILPAKNHVGAIAVGGPMPQQYIDGLVDFIDANDAAMAKASAPTGGN